MSIEACCGAADFATALAEMTEWTVRMAHPSGVNRMKQGPDKTDHTDAWHLANLLRVGSLPHVWLADGTGDRGRCGCREAPGTTRHRPGHGGHDAGGHDAGGHGTVRPLSNGQTVVEVLRTAAVQCLQRRASIRRGLIESGNDILPPRLMQLAKRWPRQDPQGKERHAKLRITKGANVASAALAHRWLRRLYGELVTKVKWKVQVHEEPVTNVKQQAS